MTSKFFQHSTQVTERGRLLLRSATTAPLLVSILAGSPVFAQEAVGMAGEMAMSLEQWQGVSNLESLIGQRLTTGTGDEIGEISKVVVDDKGNTQGVMLSIGGFSGIGGKTVTIPMEDLALSPSASSDDSTLTLELFTGGGTGDGGGRSENGSTILDRGGNITGGSPVPATPAQTGTNGMSADATSSGTVSGGGAPASASEEAAGKGEGGGAPVLPGSAGDHSGGMADTQPPERGLSGSSSTGSGSPNTLDNELILFPPTTPEPPDPQQPVSPPTDPVDPNPEPICHGPFCPGGMPIDTGDSNGMAAQGWKAKDGSEGANAMATNPGRYVVDPGVMAPISGANTPSPDSDGGKTGGGAGSSPGGGSIDPPQPKPGPGGPEQ